MDNLWRTGAPSGVKLRPMEGADREQRRLPSRVGGDRSRSLGSAARPSLGDPSAAWPHPPRWSEEALRSLRSRVATKASELGASGKRLCLAVIRRESLGGNAFMFPFRRASTCRLRHEGLGSRGGAAASAVPSSGACRGVRIRVVRRRLQMTCRLAKPEQAGPRRRLYQGAVAELAIVVAEAKSVIALSLPRPVRPHREVGIGSRQSRRCS